MITHNGTYLLFATHHGMRITAATMGGKMVIRPWLTTATQQAILAAFGSAEGTEVISKTNDYLNAIALTDPQRAQQLSGFINEDPLLVCSLVETSKVRCVVTKNNSYATTTKYNTTNNSYVKVHSKLVSVASGAYPCMFRFSNPYNVSKAIWIGQNSTSRIGYAVAGKESLDIATFDEGYHLFEISGGSFLIDGVVKSTLNIPEFINTAPETPCIIAASVNGDRNNVQNIVSVEYGEGETPSAHYVPFRRNGEMEMLDLVTGTLATRVGTFTEQLTLKQQ